MSTVAAIEPALPALVRERAALFACPVCERGLAGGPEALVCATCSRVSTAEDGILRLFWPNEWDGRADVTNIVKAFYEETPFPNYEDLDTVESLRRKAEQGFFARVLDEQIPDNAIILEAGCGTGQLSNFLGMTWGRAVFGTDMCLNSLRLGQAFKRRHGIDSVAFIQTNLFRPAFAPGTFDVVISNGVLHHTSDPEGGFRSIAHLVRPGGFIVVGLYNTFGRLWTDARRLAFKLGGERLGFLDSRMRDSSVGSRRRHTWFMDQYRHPHESKHTMGEVLHWFDEAGFEFSSAIPRTVPARFGPGEKLFESGHRGSRFDRFLVQLGMVLSGGREGGFFTMIGRKLA